MADNVIYRLGEKFALGVMSLCAYLYEEKHEYMMPKRICRSGTGIGANMPEGLFAQSDADYISKLSIALKEAGETKYWLELSVESGFITEKQYGSLSDDVKTIVGTLINIINKLKEKGLKP